MSYMKKITPLFALLFFMLLLGACAQTDLLIDEPVTSIKVYEYNTDTLVDSIDDEDTINELVKQLNGAETASTATYDFELPTYELAFKNKADEEVFTIGYFIEVVNLGVTGRYWDGNEDLMYEVEMKLAVKNE
ncbi:MAG TPA: hypothetical protein VK067_06030 [Pseudogracilibacillus sp.]|nr:hypothetical protein [Pseudogracilibacillus sp.]